MNGSKGFCLFIFRQGSRDTNFAALQGSNGKKTQEEINNMNYKALLGDAYKEGMTADEIISALEKVADPNAEIEKLRNAVTKANGEAAEYKKQLKAKRTDDENAAQEQADKLAEMQKQIEALTADKENLVKEKTLASYREKFVAQGYDAELAGKAASALADGDMDKVFKFQSEFMTAHDTAYKASLLKDMPTPPGADGNGNSADSAGVAFAKSLAQQNANTSKASSDAMSAFH
jgi:hypothetical protein